MPKLIALWLRVQLLTVAFQRGRELLWGRAATLPWVTSTVEWARLGLLNLLRQKAWEFCLKITPDSGQRPRTVCSLPLRWRGSCTPWDPRNIATVFRLVLAEGSRVQWPTAIGGRWNPGPCCWNLLGNEPALLAVWAPMQKWSFPSAESIWF